MIHPLQKEEFIDLIGHSAQIPVDKVTKSDLGKLGLPVLARAIEQIQREIRVISSVLDDVNGDQLLAATDAYRKYISMLYEVARSSGVDFVTRRDQLGQVLGEQWDVLRGIWPYFAAVALSKSGVIEDPDSAYKRILDAAQKGEAALTSLAEDVIQRARVEASKIEEAARRTAVGFSVAAAQHEFNEASKALRWKAIIWGISGAASFVWFIFFAFHVYRNPPTVFSEPLPARSSGLSEVIYLTAIRITILTAIGALTTFCMKMLRAHLHMAEFNNHRRRVANSMSAFVEAAQTPEQRDAILSRLVDAVVVFGESGILDKDSEGISVPSVAIDAITKNLSVK